MEIQSFDEAVDLVRGANRIVVCGHVNPDGDCLGSVAALTLSLRAAGKEVTPLFADDGTESGALGFLPIVDEFADPSSYTDDPDLFIALDTPHKGRLGDAQSVLGRSSAVLVMDHHPDTDDFGDLTFSDHTAAATGMLVYEFIGYLGLEMDPDMAVCCYVAIMTDTGRFQYQNTDGRCLRTAAALVDAGAVPSVLAGNIYQNRTISEMQLHSLAIENMVLSHGGRIACTWIGNDDMARLAVTKDDEEGLNDVLRSLRGVEMCAVLRQHGDVVRGSLRARGEQDVGAIARTLGGGGHRSAAGFTLQCPIDEALELVKSKLEEADR